MVRCHESCVCTDIVCTDLNTAQRTTAPKWATFPKVGPLLRKSAVQWHEASFHPLFFQICTSKMKRAPTVITNPRPLSRRRVIHKGTLDRELPSQLDVWIPESRIYMQLLNFERRLNASIIERQLLMLSAMGTARRAQKVLRLYISTEFQDVEDEDANWTLRIQGQLMEKESPPVAKFSSQLVASDFVSKLLVASDFVSKLVVELDPAVYPPSLSSAQWHKALSPSTCDGWLLKRVGDQEVQAKISVYLHHSPPEYKLSRPLSALLGITMGCKLKVLQALFSYIERENLQDAAEPARLNPNASLAKIVGSESLELKDLPSKLASHLLPPDPIVIDYTIRWATDENEPQGMPGDAGLEVFDIPVDFPDRNLDLHNMAKDKEADDLEKRIAQLIKELHQIQQKRDFLRAFCESPLNTIETLISVRALDAMGAESSLSATHHFEPSPQPEHLRRADQFQSEWLADAVDRYLEARRVADGEGSASRGSDLWPLGAA
eukprot:g56158.t1